jgi:hypothetical protein
MCHPPGVPVLANRLGERGGRSVHGVSFRSGGTARTNAAGPSAIN